MPPQSQNRKDLLQAYRLMTQRAALALVAGEPDSPNQPLRRQDMATVSAVLVGVIACAVFGVLGMLSPGPVSGLTKPGTLTMDTDTATAYVPCHVTGKQELCPTLNYASALLALDTTQVNRVSVHQAGLANYKIGPTVGLPGTPQDLPTPSDLVKDPWSMCISGGIATLVGGKSVGGKTLNRGEADLVTSGGQDWVLWNGTRMKIQDNFAKTLWSTVTPQQVKPAWLDALPQGPDFTTPNIPGHSKQISGPNGPAQVGDVYKASTASGTKFYVLGDDGKLDPLTPLQATLLEAVPGEPTEQSVSESTAASDIGTQVPFKGFPRNQPSITSASTSCVVYGSGMSRTVTTGGTIPANAIGTGSGGTTHVDRVWLPPGRGALIGVAASTNQKVPYQWFLLEGATRYSIPGQSVASILGYNLAKDQTVLPASLVEALPTGAALDPNAADHQVPESSGNPQPTGSPGASG
ncbi:MAG: type VII secretion protein EccB [Nocardiopsaceae bacterium]|nr:type VII secretion protein EccB [Nocardiopsaceae bacterium]